MNKMKLPPNYAPKVYFNIHLNILWLYSSYKILSKKKKRSVGLM